MIFQFDAPDTEEGRTAATGALIVYAIYRSRDKKRYKVSPEMWGQIERFVKASAKRARTLADFIESFKPRLCCPSINPQWLAVGMEGRLTAMGGGTYATFNRDQREFATAVLNDADDRAVISQLYRHTTWTILLVRDRLEREKPIEHTFDIDEEIQV